MRHRTLWGGLFISVNVIAFFLMFYSGELIGDVAGFSIKNNKILFYSSIAVILSYLVMVFIVPFLFEKIKYKTIKFDEVKISFRISITIFLIQILFLLFSILNGVNVAGSGNSRTDSIFSLFWVFVPSDLLFVIYYSLYRNHWFFKYNLGVALVSSILRGRADIFLSIAFFESARLIRENKISGWKVLFFSLLGVFVYPFISLLKFAFRLYFGAGPSAGEFVFAKQFFSKIEENGWVGFFFSGIEHFISRIQIVSIASEINRLSNRLLEMLHDGLYYPFWMEGIPGIVWDKVTGNPKSIPLGVAFTEVGSFSWDFNVGDWNVNPSLVSWFFIEPLWLPQIIAYVLLSVLLCYLLSNLISRDGMKSELVLYGIIFFLLPGWFGVFFLFIYSLFVFLLIKLFFELIPSFKLRSNHHIGLEKSDF